MHRWCVPILHRRWEFIRPVATPKVATPGSALTNAPSWNLSFFFGVNDGFQRNNKVNRKCGSMCTGEFAKKNLTILLVFFSGLVAWQMIKRVDQVLWQLLWYHFWGVTLQLKSQSDVVSVGYSQSLQADTYFESQLIPPSSIEMVYLMSIGSGC